MRRYRRLKSDDWESFQKSLIPNPASTSRQTIATQEKVLSMWIMLRRKGNDLIRAGGIIPNTIAKARIAVMFRAGENLLLSILSGLLQSQRTPARVRKFAAGSR